MWLCELCCRAGQRNYQSHAAGFLKTNINQTEGERAARSVAAFTIHHLRNVDTHAHPDVMQTRTNLVCHLFTVDAGYTHIYANRVMKAECVESLASPAAAEMNGRAENCLHS